MKNNNFCYCKGIGCPRREHCVRFVEGQSLPEGNWTWQCDCGGNFRDYLPVSLRINLYCYGKDCILRASCQRFLLMDNSDSSSVIDNCDEETRPGFVSNKSNKT